MNIEQIRAKALSEPGGKNDGVRRTTEQPLPEHQGRVALRNCGLIDPDSIQQYILYGKGYAGLARALTMDIKELADVLLPAALRGRGEPWCSSAAAWAHWLKKGDADRCLICDTADSDGVSAAARFIIENDPYSLLEGLLIAAYAVGAARCVVWTDGKSDPAGKLQRALKSMRDYGLLGKNILDADFSMEIGVETVELPAGHRMELLRCLEERKPLPHFSPRCDAAEGPAGRPVLAVSVEMMAALAGMLASDREDYAGSKVITLSSSAECVSVYEIPFRMTVRAFLDTAADETFKPQEIRAVRIGGSAGTICPVDTADISAGCDEADEFRSSLGSGSIDLIAGDADIVEFTREAISRLQAGSCGRCVFCREGSLQMLTVLEDICRGSGTPRDLDLLMELGETMKTSSLCSYGRVLPNPVLSGIRHFRRDYEKRVGGPPVADG
ncbi:MAG TPA: NADH-ubiquinone oxidoreductase-F iron-sulfur binding region domain-containing protein [Acidobacteriota bacterium]|nr:NADH-ubiquinone oxidoreductase-F iron-sulfur binding region domain-containing protein [Acidobacteriota bacterium]